MLGEASAAATGSASPDEEDDHIDAMPRSVSTLAATSNRLVLVLTPLGDSEGIAQRWIDLGLIQFQPSEVAKIAVVLMLASVLAAVDPPLDWKTVARSLVLVGVLVL